MNALGISVIKYRWFIIVMSIFLALTASFGLKNLIFNPDTRVFFSKENPQLQAFELLENIYSKNYNVLFMVEPPDGDVFTRRTLSVIEELTKAAWQIPYSSRVDSITNFQHTQGLADELVVENLVSDAITLSDAELVQKKKIALSEISLVNTILSPTGHVTGINVNILIPGKSIEEVPAVANFSQQLNDSMQAKYPDIKFQVTGAVLLDYAFSEITEADMAVLVPAMFITLIVIIGLFLRSFYGTMVTVLVVLLSVLVALGLMGWLGFSLNPATANAPIIILTLAVADSVHILVTMYQNMRQGENKNNAIILSLNDNLKPVLLTSVTTIIGFLTMNFSDVPPFRDLGNVVALGITAAFFYSILFLPALMSVLPIKINTQSKIQTWSCKTFCNRLTDFVIQKSRIIFWSTLGICVVLAGGLSQIELNEDFIKYFSEDYAVRITGDYMEENLTGADTIEFSLDSGEPNGINKPEYLNKIDEFANWYRQQEKVVHVTVFSDIMKRLNKNMHADKQNWYKIPEQRNLAAQYVLLYEMSLPLGRDLNNQINVDKSATRLIVVVKDANTSEQRALDRKGQNWLKNNAPEMHTYGTGLSIIWAYLSERNIRAMLFASFGALILISLILIFALRSVKYGLLSLAPNLIPAVMAFGIWGLLVGRVGLGLSIVVSMTLGIVVDDTVHFIDKYLKAHREQRMDIENSIRYAFNTVGEAMWITTIALVAGFLILVFSDYKMNAEMGLMTAITICLALVMDFIFLPSLLIRVGHNLKTRNKPQVLHKHDTVILN